jgi:hypothetical protein
MGNIPKLIVTGSPPDKPTEKCNWWCRNNDKGQLENEHREKKKPNDMEIN